jgi:uncharacterized membrane protein
MPRWYDRYAVIAILFAAGAILPFWPATGRIICALLAFAIIIIVLIVRLQRHASSLTGKRSTLADMESRIDRIRADREKRFSRR